jgi:modulator of FtsH protease
MSNSPDLSAWSNFFVTAAGASAALVGLLFVAVSINLPTILEHAWLPARAALVVIILVDALVCGLIGLVPGLPMRTSGVGFFVTGLLASALTAFAQTRARARSHYNASRGLVVLQVVAVQIGPLGFALAGASLVWGFPGGVYWVVPGMLFTFVGAMFVSWVLLVEIRR